MAQPTLWAGIDAGKAAHHCVAMNADGQHVLSRRVVNDEGALLGRRVAARLPQEQRPGPRLTSPRAADAPTTAPVGTEYGTARSRRSTLRVSVVSWRHRSSQRPPM